MIAFPPIPIELFWILKFAFLGPWNSYSPMWPLAVGNVPQVAPVRTVPGGNFGPVLVSSVLQRTEEIVGPVFLKFGPWQVQHAMFVIHFA